MSFQETIKGEIIKLLPLENETLEEQAKRILNCELNTRWYDTFLNQLLDTDGYFIIGTTIYQSIITHNMGYDDYCIIEKIDDNKYSFVTSFYNGGTCLGEMLDEELRKYEK